MPELFLGDQNTLTYIDQVGWTTLRDLEPLPAVPVPAPVVPDDYAVVDTWDGGSLGWKWMVPVAAALLLFVVIGTVIGLQPSDAVASEAVTAAPEPSEAPAPAAAAQDADKQARWAAIAATPDRRRGPRRPARHPRAPSGGRRLRRHRHPAQQADRHRACATRDQA